MAKPLWREVYDRIADEIGPALTGLTGSEQFVTATDTAAAVRLRVEREVQRSSRRVLHSWNLPAGTDITVLRREIGDLERQVRLLTREVERLRAEVVPGHTGPPSALVAPAPDGERVRT